MVLHTTPPKDVDSTLIRLNAAYGEEKEIGTLTLIKVLSFGPQEQKKDGVLLPEQNCTASLLKRDGNVKKNYAGRA
jgi:hypothetical protein